MNDGLKQRFDECINCLPKKIYDIISKIPDSIKTETQEISLRINRPLCLYSGRNMYFVRQNGTMTSNHNTVNLLYCTKYDIEETFCNICHHSLYSKQTEIKNGFVTMNGGHRAGISGTAVYDSNNQITNIRDISSLNIRIAREIKGVATVLLRVIDFNSGGVLLCGEPSSGKTTLLRDMARQLSKDRKVSVIDERGEIAGIYNGICQNDMGMCDILNGYRKTDGILQAIRSMSPQVIICDEVGSLEETECIKESLNSGVKVVASVHCRSKEEFFHKPQTLNLLHTRAFAYIVFLDNRKHAGQIQKVCSLKEMEYDESHRLSDDNSKHNADRILSFHSHQEAGKIV